MKNSNNKSPLVSPELSYFAETVIRDPRTKGWIRDMMCRVYTMAVGCDHLYESHPVLMDRLYAKVSQRKQLQADGDTGAFAGAVKAAMAAGEPEWVMTYMGILETLHGVYRELERSHPSLKQKAFHYATTNHGLNGVVLHESPEAAEAYGEAQKKAGNTDIRVVGADGEIQEPEA
jgi:hypothetical protein